MNNTTVKIVRSENYNYVFRKTDGYFIRWGKSFEDDPNYSTFGPEIADIEITTKCTGTDGKLCKFCYKSNTPDGKNMSFETFQKIFHKLPKNLTQIAFGTDSHATSNPDLFKMMEYCRNNNYNQVIPNITIAEIDDKIADKLANVCGAVAVSRYDNKNICYDAVKKLTDRGMSQVNIHQMISEETFENALQTLEDKLTDLRLSKLNAIVFLSLKQKGRGMKYTPLTQEKFQQLINKARKNNINIGFDSCSAIKFLKASEKTDNLDWIQMCCESCESTLFSVYINVDGEFFPCSFCEGEKSWEKGISVLNCDDFLKDIWFSSEAISFRNKLLKTVDNNKFKCRECPVFSI